MGIGHGGESVAKGVHGPPFGQLSADEPPDPIGRDMPPIVTGEEVPHPGPIPDEACQTVRERHHAHPAPLAVDAQGPPHEVPLHVPTMDHRDLAPA